MARHQQNEASLRLETIPGIGLIPAPAPPISASDPGVLQSGRQFAAWLGLVPRQSSSDGKGQHGRVSKMGNGCLRRSLVVGATSVTRRAEMTGTRTGAWVRSSLERKRCTSTLRPSPTRPHVAWALLARCKTCGSAAIG
ncbi:transposase [Allitabrizicola rongguiensis]|uniref:transposase n=1 Tax=Alitabrizicola rongguiensis TaxID=2909234 RepID=UPI003873C779